jgi:ABC-type uncharacterized transport system permease subunit
VILCLDLTGSSVNQRRSRTEHGGRVFAVPAVCHHYPPILDGPARALMNMFSILILPMYVAASLLALWRLKHRPAEGPDTEASSLAAPLAASAGLLVHGLTLAQATASAGGLSVADTFSLTGWMMGGVGLWLLTRPNLVGLAVLLLPIAGLMALPTGLEGGSDAGVTYEWTTRTHIGLSLVAYTTLMLAAVLAVLMAIQHNRLRTRRLGGGMGGLTSLLPPLETTERALFATIGFGFLMLSLSILSGLMFIENVFAQHLAHKTILSILAWVEFGVLLLGRWRFGWRGHVALAWTLGGFTSLALAYFGSRIVLEFVLNQHWG